MCLVLNIYRESTVECNLSHGGEFTFKAENIGLVFGVGGRASSCEAVIVYGLRRRLSVFSEFLCLY